MCARVKAAMVTAVAANPAETTMLRFAVLSEYMPTAICAVKPAWKAVGSRAASIYVRLKVLLKTGSRAGMMAVYMWWDVCPSVKAGNRSPFLSCTSLPYVEAD